MKEFLLLSSLDLFYAYTLSFMKSFKFKFRNQNISRVFKTSQILLDCPLHFSLLFKIDKYYPYLSFIKPVLFLLLWFKIFNFMSVFKIVRYFIQMIFEIFKDISAFMYNFGSFSSCLCSSFNDFQDFRRQSYSWYWILSEIELSFNLRRIRWWHKRINNNLFHNIHSVFLLYSYSTIEHAHRYNVW
jgi:hypothetical protein